MNIFTRTLDITRKYWKVVAVVSVFILAILLFKSCQDNIGLRTQLKNEKQRSEQNMHALNDTITLYKNRDGDTSYKKTIANMSIDELKEFNPALYKALKAEGGKVRTIVQTEVRYVDSGSVPNILLDNGDGNYSQKFDYTSSDLVLSIHGRSTFQASVRNSGNDYTVGVTPGQTIIDSSTVNLGLTVGIKKDGEFDRIFVTPSSSRVIVSKIDGTDVSDYVRQANKQKRKNFSLNLSTGYGVMFARGNTMYHGPFVGIGLGYNIINF